MINENDFLKKACRFMNESAEDDLPVEAPAEEAPAPSADDLPPETENGEDKDENCVDCPDCGGTGTITDEEGNEIPCETCDGEGCVNVDDVEFDFDPAEGVCPCCGAHLNVIEPDEESLAGDSDEDLDDGFDDDLDDGFDDDLGLGEEIGDEDL